MTHVAPINLQCYQRQAQVKSSQVCFTNMQNESSTGGKRRKTLRSPKSAAPSINNLKRFTLSSISLDVKIIKKKTETHLQQKQHKHRVTEMNVKKEAELHKHIGYNKKRVKITLGR